MRKFGDMDKFLPSCQVTIVAKDVVNAELYEKVVVTGSEEDLNFYIHVHATDQPLPAATRGMAV